jgi:hypothetical protein
MLGITNFFTAVNSNNCSTYAWKGTTILYKSAKDSANYMATFLVAAFALSYFFTFTTLPCLVITTTIFLTRTFIRILEKTSHPDIKSNFIRAKQQIYDIGEKHPMLSYATVIVSIASSAIYTPLSISTAVAYGIYIGIHIDIEKIKESAKDTNPSAEKSDPRYFNNGSVL